MQIMVKSTVTERSYRENLKRLREDIEKKNGKPAEQLYREKQKRLWDVIEMKEPDRVPVLLGGSYFAARYAGLPYSIVYYDFYAWKQAFTSMLADFGPDAAGEGITSSGAYLDILGAKNTLWPGGTLPDDIAHQAVDGEYMKEDEYDCFLEDITDFHIRRFLPRVYTALEPLSRLPSMGVGMWVMSGAAPVLATEEYKKLGQVLARAGEEHSKWSRAMANFNEDMEFLGFPPFSRGGFATGGPAYDVMANTYRGWKGIIRDMYRRPKKLMAAMEKITDMQIARAQPADTTPGPKIGGGGAIHRGSDRFLSKKQWETFYWPTWKKSMQKAIELGYIPFIFAEGFCEERFEYFLEFPRGSLVIRFTDTDMFKAKAALGDHFCLMGSVPLTLLQMASPSEVDEYCKKLIQVCGKGGGYIMRSDTDYIQDAKPENVRVMIDSVEKYGRYG
jgi:hypothetical protein